MKRLFISLAALTLSACEVRSDTIEISPREWSCTAWGNVTRSIPVSLGRVTTYREQTTLECVQWRRIVTNVPR